MISNSLLLLNCLALLLAFPHLATCVYPTPETRPVRPPSRPPHFTSSPAILTPPFPSIPTSQLDPKPPLTNLPPSPTAALQLPPSPATGRRERPPIREPIQVLRLEGAELRLLRRAQQQLRRHRPAHRPRAQVRHRPAYGPEQLGAAGAAALLRGPLHVLWWADAELESLALGTDVSESGSACVEGAGG